jgi:hypothetical protein
MTTSAGASVKSESQLAEFAGAALEKLKRMPDKLRAFFGDLTLRYIQHFIA